MEIAEVFAFDDYKKFLNRTLRSKGNWGMISKMADAIGCQRSYLSRVLTSHVQLTPDQALAISQFLSLSESEQEYFVLLVDRDRAATLALKKHLQIKISNLMRQRENLSSRLDRPSLESAENEILYYSSWIYSAIHILISIPAYQDVRAISEHLHVPASQVELVLGNLQVMGLAKKQGQKWKIGKGEIHLAKTSPLLAGYHQHWRQLAVHKVQMGSREGVHYTVARSMSRIAYQNMKLSLVNFIENYTAETGPSKEECLVTFNCDLFEV